MAFVPHNLRDAEWAAYLRIPTTDTQYPPITAKITDYQEFNGTSVVSYKTYDRFAVIVEDYKNFSSTNSLSAHSITTTSAKVLNANLAMRKGFKCVNSGSNSVYLLEGAGTASSSNQTVTIAAGEFYESKNPVWTGEVNAVGTGTTTLVVTEYT